MEKKQMRLWKKVLLLLLLIIFILGLMIIRKMVIIKDLDNKVSSYENYKNYYIKETTYSGNSITISEIYKKDNKSLIILTNYNFENDGKNVIKVFNDSNNTNTYYETDNNKKIAYLNQKNNIQLNITNEVETKNFFNLLVKALNTRISSKNCNEKLCYAIETIIPPKYSDITYIEKDTGLVVRKSGITGTVDSDEITTDNVEDYIYSFDTVTDSDIIEPNIDEYEIHE